MVPNPYTTVQFLKSAAKLNQLPEDTGIEVAFAGRSNAGKSSALNRLTNIKQLARTSKTPGRTQLINVFTLRDDGKRLIDLPGYGFAQVSKSIKENWQKTLSAYLEYRESLKGLVLLMDIRHPLSPLDEHMLQFARHRGLAVHVLLTKADKISKSKVNSTLLNVKKQCGEGVSVQAFSTLKQQGLETLIGRLNDWFE